MLEMRTSERRGLKSCAQQWWWDQVEGLVPNRAATPLWFGTAVHEALAGWYIPGTVRGANPIETFMSVLEGDRAVLVTNEEEEQEYVDSRELGIDMLTRYLDHYGDEEWKDYIAAEYAGAVVFPRPERTANGVVIPEMKRWLKYHFTWDGVYRDLRTDELWLDEHKTAASIWNDFLPLDDQAGSYWAIAVPLLRKKGLLGPKEEIAGIMYNFLRKAVGDTRPIDEEGFRRNKPTKKEHYIAALEAEYEVDEKMTLAVLQATAEEAGIEVWGDVSASQPPPYFERFAVYRSRGERATMIRRIKDEAIIKEGLLNGSIPLTKSPSVMNCRMCKFKRLCELDEQGDYLSVQEFKDVAFGKRDPYDVYRNRKSAEGGV